ncbi:MlaD family protein [Lentisphaerota bacterium ZTH]|nr:MCE family protein [Lentisphaerota bacterium]WET06707.1 MlaD family protein [Lentisphaerota bacterium ZTH]
MIEANKFRLGLFVLIGIALFLACLFVFGLSDMFTKKARFVSVFRESVQGLNIGSSVKYKGVPVGTVKKISILVDEKLILVDMDIDLSFFTTGKSKVQGNLLQKFYQFCRSERDKGLRCRLEYAGITGLKFVEIDYFAQPGEPVAIPRPDYLRKDVFYVPSSPGVFSDILKLINVSLERISKIDFENISNQMSSTLGEMKKIVSDPKLKKAIEQLKNMSSNLEKSSESIAKVLTEKRLRQIFNRVEDSLNSLDALAKRVTSQLGQAKLPATSKAFREAAESVNDTKQMLGNTLMKLDQAIDALTELVNYLNDDPSSLLKGKKKPKIDFPEPQKK